jgi:nucleotide-binding universal stress UspA family protein
VKRLVVAYDGSTAARRALYHTSEWARAGDRVTVVNVMAEPGIGAQIGPPTERRQHQWRVLQEARELLTARGIDAEVSAPVGETVAEIVAVAEQVGADVIVVARHRRKTPPHLHASITGRIVRAADCDVVVIHTAGAESESRS